MILTRGGRSHRKGLHSGRKAARLSYFARGSVFKAVNNDHALPEECPKQLLSEYAHLGESLSISCTLRFAPPKQDIAHVTKRDRDQLISIAETSYEDELDITGRVLGADVRKRQFQIWIDEKTSVVASFTREQEAQITSALKEHESVRLRVRGRGEFTPEGKPRKAYQVVSLDSISSDGTGFDAGAPQIEDVITNIFREPLMHMAPVARVCHQMLRLRLGRGNG